MAEQFFVEMMRIDRYEQRIRAMYFKRRFQERIAEITPVFYFILFYLFYFILFSRSKTFQFTYPLLEH